MGWSEIGGFSGGCRVRWKENVFSGGIGEGEQRCARRNIWMASVKAILRNISLTSAYRSLYQHIKVALAYCQGSRMLMRELTSNVI